MGPDLFSFLSNPPPEDSDDEVVSSAPKRKSSPETKTLENETHDDGAALDVTSRPLKRLRAASPAPVVVDDFQTEAKRELAASGGLTGPVDTGSRLELRHQACLRSSPIRFSHILLSRSGIKWPFPRGTAMCRFQSMSHLQSLHGSTSSRWTLSSRYLCTLFSGTRAYWYQPILVLERLSWQNMP